MSPASDVPTLSPDVVRALAAGTTDWISSWWTVAAVAALAVALLALGWRASRRRAAAGRPRRRWITIASASVATVLALALAANVTAGYFPTVGALGRWTGSMLGLDEGGDDADGGAPAGEVAEVTIPVPADVSMPSSSTWIYTPPGYDASRTYPVLLLAHGSPGTSADWITAGEAPHVLDVLIDAGVIDPVIAVAFDMNGTGPGADDTECLDSTTGGSDVESYLDDVVVPWVDATYATNGTHLIAGFSAGAFCALDQGLRHPETYAGIVAIAPYLDPGSGGEAMLATAAERAAHDVRAYAPALPTADQAVALMLVDDDDGTVREHLVQTADDLRGVGRSVLLHQVDAGHTWAGAREAFPLALVDVARHLGLTPVTSTS
ncbi:alpha/beta hydrolase [Serinibacter arcticus]|uniref:Putative esterase n=1 Tax=Serinibacter arcticus TaxID=1655435 RepID=A0A4Z1E5H2_9MICO|nr:alpha/beta hydrolase-fold protein [Serinibacter arcticus]TGO06570.1 putative esterase [Serinibacter arcticus]